MYIELEKVATGRKKVAKKLQQCCSMVAIGKPLKSGINSVLYPDKELQKTTGQMLRNVKV